MASIDEYRVRIDELDQQIVSLLNERAQCARAIGELKNVSGRAAFAPDRERRVLEKVAAQSRGPLAGSALQSIYREIMSACRALEKPLQVAYWGPPASNSHVAARRRFGGQVALVALGSIPDIFDAVGRGDVDFGVVPVENSTEGVIAITLDQFIESEVQICAETFVPIQHNLLSRATDIADVRQVYSMFQATGQCREWIRKHLGGVPLIDVTTTARGAELASREPDTAAIANLTAAEEYGLNVLAENIEDNPRNYTRFWVITQKGPQPSGADKTSLLFSVPHQAGALVTALQAFESHGVSMTFIESRPTKQTPWEYLFFVDVQGHIGEGPDTQLSAALAELEKRTAFVRVLGSYPEAEDHRQAVV